MNVSSVRLNQTSLSEKEAAFISAKNGFSTKESIFEQVNSQYLSSQEEYSSKSFQESLLESSYGNLQDKMTFLRQKNKSYERVNFVSTNSILKHEAALKEDPMIQQIEAGISESQTSITEQQALLNTLKNSPEVVQYRVLTAKITRLQDSEASIIEQITEKTKNGEDATALEIKLAKIRKEIEEKQKLADELQPKYDEMQSVESELESLLSENANLKQQRTALDPELVNYNKFSALMQKVIQGDDNGLGVNDDISENKSELNEVKELFENSSMEASSFKELLDKNLTITSSVKTDLESSKALREERERSYLEIKS